MDYLDYEAEDFLLDPSFRNFCLGTDEADRLFWEQWIILNPTRYETVQEAKRLYHLLNGNITQEQYNTQLQIFKTALSQHISERGTATQAPTDTPPTPVFRLRKYHVAAAAAIAAVILYALVVKQKTKTTEKAPVSLVARVSRPGERTSFQLSDGTKVMLNAGSVINIPKDFNDSIREISLEGEAFFDVAKDARHPFVIHTSVMDVKVLGTSFNIKAYPKDKTFETSLVNGSVEVNIRKENRKILLHPSQKVVIFNGITGRDTEPLKSGKPASSANNYELATIRVNPVDSSIAELSWTENKLVFNDNSLDEIAMYLERWYNVTIQFSDPVVKNFRFTATFDKKNIAQVLEALSSSRYFEYRQDPNNSTLFIIGDMKNER